MRRSSLALVGMFLLVGCSGFGGEESSEGPSVVDGQGDKNEITEEHGFFVSNTGSDDAPGTRERPLATIATAQKKATDAKKSVFVCAGSYPESVVVLDGVSMLGGLDCSTRVWTTSPRRSKISSATSPAVLAKDITSPTVVDGFEIVAPDATQPSASSIALFAVRSPALSISHSRLQAGRGGNGSDGVEPIRLKVVGDPAGGQGEDSRACFQNGVDRLCPTSSLTTAAGHATCEGAVGHDPGAGGEGGKGGTRQRLDGESQWTPTRYKLAMTTLWVGDDEASGEAGGLSGGEGGAPGMDGTDGPKGADGTAGANGTTIHLTEAGVFAADGVPGLDGAPGGGGGGGRANSATSNTLNSGKWRGAAGGGGGAGGCPGLAGTPGTGGGSSIAIAAFESPLTIDASELVTGSGGNAGAGTLPSQPSAGGVGGLGGILSVSNGTTYRSARGGNGGSGGRGGVSGSGAGGPSVGIAFTGAPPTRTKTTVTLGKGGVGAPSAMLDQAELPASPPGVSSESLGL